MRHFIDIVAEGKKRLVPDPAAVAAERAAKAKAEAQALHDKAMKVSAELARESYDIRGGWSSKWVLELRGGFAEARKRHDDVEREETDYAREEGRQYVPRPFNAAEAAVDVFAGWWDRKKMTIDLVGDADHAYNDYLDAHPRVEMSDELSLRRAERDAARTIYFRGGLGGAAEMLLSLDALDGLVQPMFDMSGLVALTPAMEAFITKGIPVMVSYAKLMGAVKPA